MIFVALILSIAGMAAIAIWAYRNVAPDMEAGIALARRTLESGAALTKLEQLKAFVAA